jgi:hypothetical protein
MAQDFHAAFGLGENDTSIGLLDSEGVALAAIQGLYAVVQDQHTEIAALKAENSGLEARVAALEQRAGGQPAAPDAPPSVPVSWVAVAGVAGAAFWLGRRRRHQD